MSEPFKKEFIFRGYDSGDYECFCFAIPPEDCKPNKWKWDAYSLNRFHKGMVSIYPNQLLGHLDNQQAYQFKITIEATPIDSATLPSILPKVLKMFYKRFKHIVESDRRLQSEQAVFDALKGDEAE